MSARPIPYRDPAEAFAAFAHEPGAVLLDSAAAGDARSRWSYIATAPKRVIEQRGGAVSLDGQEVGDDLLGALRSVLGEGGGPASSHAPFSGGLIGFIGYEAARAIAFREFSHARDAVQRGGEQLQARFGLYDTVAAHEVVGRKAWIVGVRADDLAHRIATAPPPTSVPSLTATWTAELDRPEVERRIAEVIAYIEAGDIYQANFTQRFFAERPSELSAYDLYRRLRARAPGPFSAFFNTGALQLASVSPERFVSLSAAGEIETRPIKGTRPRHVDPALDAALAAELLASDKDRAENLMIADLMRNDLSRVAVPGSVRAPSLMQLESFPGAHHLVSSITAQLSPGRDAFDLLAATLPGGSITGAPKMRAMQIIEALEAGPRGPYCGALVRIGFDGAMDSSILIRTLVVEGERVTAQAGGGIVADSYPGEEYEEAMVKLRPLLAALSEA